MPITYSASRPNYQLPRFEQKVAPLLEAIEAFLAINPHMTEGKFGCLSCNSYYVVRSIRRNANISLKTERSIREFMKRYAAPVGTVSEVVKFNADMNTDRYLLSVKGHELVRQTEHPEADRRVS